MRRHLHTRAKARYLHHHAGRCQSCTRGSTAGSGGEHHSATDPSDLLVLMHTLPALSSPPNNLAQTRLPGALAGVHWSHDQPAPVPHLLAPLVSPSAPQWAEQRGCRVCSSSLYARVWARAPPKCDGDRPGLPAGASCLNLLPI